MTVNGRCAGAVPPALWLLAEQSYIVFTPMSMKNYIDIALSQGYQRVDQTYPHDKKSCQIINCLYPFCTITGTRWGGTFDSQKFIESTLLPKELLCIRRKTFYIAALSLCINRIEGEA